MEETQEPVGVTAVVSTTTAPQLNPSSALKHFLRDTVCGTTAGVAGIIVGYPLDTIKITLQTNPTYNGSISALLGIVRNQGVMALFRGLASPTTGYAASSAVCFSTYGAALRWQKNDPHESTTQRQVFLAGGMAGFTLSFISNPIDRIKIIMQSQSSTDKPKYKNTLSCARDIIRTQGIRSLYYGLVANWMKEVYGSAAWFGFYHAIKTMNTSSETDVSIGSRIFAGGMAGSLAWTCIYPFDVIRSRMLKEENYQHPRYKNTLDCWRTSFRTEGISWCYRGWRATIIRGFPVGAIILTLNDVLLGLVNNHY